MKKILLSIFLVVSQLVFSQYSITSTNGFTANINLTAVQVNAPATCQYGYTYTVDILYEIVFTGSKQKPFNTLQGFLNCGGTSSFFNLPNAGGTGITTTSNAYTSATNCSTVTPSTLECTSVTLQIQAPGIPNQFVTFNIGTSPLPIELVDFKGVFDDGRKVNLNWQTATERNNEYFTVERSKDGQNWEKIDEVIGAGNSESELFYNYTDNNPLIEKISYYRLRQTDFDGKSTLSHIITIDRNTNPSDKVLIYPNPANDFVIIENSSENLTEFSIYNLYGVKLVHRTLLPSDNKQIINVDTSQLPSGVYYVITADGKFRFNKI